MARQSAQHIPHFGNWNANEGPGFTMVFEKMHIESGTSKAVNPNETVKNPAALGNGVQPFDIDRSDNPMNVHQSRQEEVYEKDQHRGTTQRTREGFDGKQRFQEAHEVRVARKLGSDGNKAGAESPSHHAYKGRLGNKPGPPYPERKISGEGGSTASGTPGRSRLRTSTENERGTVLPKFGAWNETDPTAGEGYTTIFNQARTEKKTGGPAWIPSTDSSAAPRHSQRSQKMSSSGRCCTIL